ncbi:hypothetical protein BOTBODRAFT_39838 [Botryobasidium botryosum FD-172 SS1]|uniref:Uncharacterized protein n=1 Tax=Botryobasidium botryosum (strain FD-172 SS1) TaxID=930990 RepID=A0A067M2I4_BOTB1|nr:hypothetical protein BOTBODRAFT_39838 [Botryobasidium botryosum FD-172 SS1]
MVDTFLQANPVIFISALTFFRAKAWRLGGIRWGQSVICRVMPPNGGIVTGLLCYLFRCVESTPTHLQKYVRAAIAQTHGPQIMARFGAYFLHTFDPSHANPLPEAGECDDEQVAKVISQKSRRQAQARRAAPQAGVERPSEQFPIGATPTWDEVKQAVVTRPGDMLVDPPYQEAWEQDAIAAKVFVSFTRQFWSIVKAERLVSGFVVPQHLTLREAMGYWSVRFAQENLAPASFVPTNAGLRGPIQGQRAKSFYERVGVFFPDPAQPIGRGSPWAEFCRAPGYVWFFWDQARDQDTRSAVLGTLGEIFTHLQCLPPSAPFKSKDTPGSLWPWDRETESTPLITNARLYKIDSVSAPRRKERVTVVGARTERLQQIQLSEGWHPQAALGRTERQQRAPSITEGENVAAPRTGAAPARKKAQTANPSVRAEGGKPSMGGRRMVTRLLSGRARNPGKDAHAPLAARSQRRYISGIGRKRPRDWSDDESQGEGGQGKGDESEDEDIPGGEASDSYDGGSGQATDTSQSEYQDEDSS